MFHTGHAVFSHIAIDIGANDMNQPAGLPCVTSPKMSRHLQNDCYLFVEFTRCSELSRRVAG